ncbi:MAG: hypothetical protein ABDI07_03320, partial [Candidatus Kryptonium sp.]
MKKFVFIFSVLISINLFAQETKPEERRFRVDTTAIDRTKTEFVLPEFIITGRETVEVEVGQKIEVDEVILPSVNLNFYKIKNDEKVSSDVSIRTEGSKYVELFRRNPVAKFKTGVGRYLA